MAYESCPECNEQKHQLMACPKCGFKRLSESDMQSIPKPKAQSGERVYAPQFGHSEFRCEQQSKPAKTVEISYKKLRRVVDKTQMVSDKVSKMNSEIMATTKQKIRDILTRPKKSFNHSH